MPRSFVIISTEWATALRSLEDQAVVEFKYINIKAWINVKLKLGYMSTSQWIKLYNLDVKLGFIYFILTVTSPFFTKNISLC